MSDKKGIWTGNTSRDTLGVRSVVNPSHEGPAGRRVEEAVIKREESGEMGGRPSTPETPMNNPGFGRS